MFARVVMAECARVSHAMLPFMDARFHTHIMTQS